MDDNDLCPLCCEELDMSDRQFFPCKCGYQVCMWCWHRIRESESGLCPACRTPYGDDPHEFSAVDMEQVVKANKEKAAAEKREKERLRAAREQQLLQLQANASGVSAYPLVSSGSSSNSLDANDAPIMSRSSVHVAPLDPPKDRNQLANMRVIRRNLVYAVGLPPSIAAEETLRKAEYFGEYGKIAKIVINRNYNGNGDPRRASASAYVTFAHKEDTLACILALDGFYLEGRNIRASYGTSKYCSAFIKNVRCNNPDCTYLHGMGDSDDTFTKQEIQAGYVTSGRDVLAKQQAQMAAASSSSGSTRRRVGGGGPSGTGKVCSNPSFPAPCFDEPAREKAGSSFVTAPIRSHVRSSSLSADNRVSASSAARPAADSGVSVHRIASSTAGRIATDSNMTVSHAAAVANTLPATRARSSSTGAPNNAPQANTIPAIQKAEKMTRQRTAPAATSKSKGGIGAHSVSSASSGNINGTSGTTAASVVAAAAAATPPVNIPIQPPPHTTLTQLTPLKRTSSLPAGGTKNSSSKPSKPIPPPPTSNSNGSKTSGPAIIADGTMYPPNTILPCRSTDTADSSSSTPYQVRRITSSNPSSTSASPIGARKTPNSGRSTPEESIPTSSFIGGSVLMGNNTPPGTIGNPPPNHPSNPPTSVGGSIGFGGLSALPGLPMNNSNPGSAFQNLSFGAIGSASNNSTAGFGGMQQQRNTLGSIGGDKNNPQNPPPPSHMRNYPPAVGMMKQGQWEEDKTLLTPGGLFGNNGGFGGGMGGVGGIWGDAQPAPTAPGIHNRDQSQFPAGFPQNSNNNNPGFPPSGGNNSNTIGDSRHNQILGKNPFAGDSGSNALASMLGIDLPTGSGSLRENHHQVHPPNTNNLHGSGGGVLPPPPQYGNAPFSSFSSVPIGGLGGQQDSLWSGNNNVNVNNQQLNNANQLNNNSLEHLHYKQQPQPPQHPRSNMQAIGSPQHRNHNGQGPVGGTMVGGVDIGGQRNNNNDIALLQSLLPGVHITSGHAHQPAAPWAPNQQQQDVGNQNERREGDNSWGAGTGLYGNGGRNVQQQGMPNQSSSIW